jgi:hypothetical protein
MRALLLAGGVIHALAVVFHIALPRRANWQDVVSSLPAGERGDLYVLNAAVGCALLLFAVLSLGYPEDLISTRIGRVTILMIALFWTVRAAGEIAWYPAPSPWIVGLCIAMGALHTLIAWKTLVAFVPGIPSG